VSGWTDVQRIFVGDVQGCAEELEELYDRAEAQFSDDFALWIAGDLVNRGPDNRRALERVRRLVEDGRGEYVLGNHEIHLIASGLGLRDLDPNDSIGDVLSDPDAAEWVDWIRRRPVVAIGELGGGGDAGDRIQPFVMVHAAAPPTWGLDQLAHAGAAVQARLSGDRDEARSFLATDPATDSVREDLARLTRCRSATDDEWSSREPDSPEGAWHAAWSRHAHDYGVVYGHWARQGLHVARGLRGLDSGCVHHGRGHDGFLTAWLPESAPPANRGRPFDVPDDRFWQVPARRRYYYPEAAAGR
jgi:bis(5'-nucleosyl)-tetraphosphatase (symmetrical)